MVGEHFFVKMGRCICRYPVGQKFSRNPSNSYSFRDKCILGFYAEIEDDPQNGKKKILWKNGLIPLHILSDTEGFKFKMVFAKMAFFGEIVFNKTRYRSSETIYRLGYFQSSVSV